MTCDFWHPSSRKLDLWRSTYSSVSHGALVTLSCMSTSPMRTLQGTHTRGDMPTGTHRSVTSGSEKCWPLSRACVPAQ